MSRARSTSVAVIMVAQMVLAGHVLAQTTSPPDAPPSPTGGPVVTLHADNPAARLQQQLQLQWRNICVVPCGVPVDPAGTYRVGGGTIRPSLELRMPRPSGPVLLDVQTGSVVKHWVGFGLTLGGGLAALAGVGYIALAPYATENGQKTTTAKDTFRAIGIAELVSGVVLAAVGVPLWMSHTSVEVR
jgi:hypothetical protein